MSSVVSDQHLVAQRTELRCGNATIFFQCSNQVLSPLLSQGLSDMHYDFDSAIRISIYAM